MKDIDGRANFFDLRRREVALSFLKPVGIGFFALPPVKASEDDFK